MVYPVTITVHGLTRRSWSGQKNRGGTVLVSVEEGGLVSVPAEGSIASCVSSIVDMVRTSSSSSLNNLLHKVSFDHCENSSECCFGM